MTIQTAALDAVNAVYDVLAADATLLGYADSLGLRIFDGPPIDDRSASIELWVGATGLEDENDQVTVQQEWATSNISPDIDEQADIVCAIWGFDGSTDLRTVRGRVKQVYTACAVRLRASTLSVDGVLWLQVTGYSLRQLRGASGTDVLLTFNVRVRARL